MVLWEHQLSFFYVYFVEVTVSCEYFDSIATDVPIWAHHRCPFLNYRVVINAGMRNPCTQMEIKSYYIASIELRNFHEDRVRA